MDKILPAILTYAASVANGMTDFAVAKSPVVIIRKFQMRARLKLFALACLSGEDDITLLAPIDIM